VVRAYVALTKPRIIELLLVTTVPAMMLAAGGWPSWRLLIATLVGGTLAAGGANTLNCWIERDRDQVMRRTHDRPLPAGEIGEVCVRGPNVMLGYYRMPEETARTVREGRLHTGDMGRLDADGFLYIVERKKDLIIRGGFNIYPREVEQVLYAHPAVAEAAVVGMRDPLMGEEVCAFVVLKPGAIADADAIVDFCRSRLAKYKCPREVRFLTALPKNPVGKILRKELRALV
jgi:acyl-CoA synthetase (AMP-forming)/AMP-acid ligase II